MNKVIALLNTMFFFFKKKFGSHLSKKTEDKLTKAEKKYEKLFFFYRTNAKNLLPLKSENFDLHEIKKWFHQIKIK